MIKIGIIGITELSNKMAKAIKTIKEFELNACYDIDYNLSKEFSLTYELIPYRTIEDLFRYVDAICICISSSETNSLIQLCLKNFKHCFLPEAEKLDFDKYHQLIKLSEESNVKLYLEYGSVTAFLNQKQNLLANFRPDYIDVKFNVNSIHNNCESFGFKRIVMKNIDSILYFFKERTRKVIAVAWNFKVDHFGLLNIRLEFENGSTINMIISDFMDEDQLLINLFSSTNIAKVVMNKSTLTCAIENKLGICKINQRENIGEYELLLSDLIVFKKAIDSDPEALQKITTLTEL